MAYLTKEIADALCTIITLGFAAPEASEIERRGNMTFEYDAPGDRADYERVREIFNGLGVPIVVQPSPSQTIMPFVLGTNLPLALTQNFIDSLIDRSDTVGRMMAGATGANAPRGAYIGIAFTVDATTGIPVPGIDPLIYGPSELCQYDPVYRQVRLGIDDSVKKAYQTAMTYTNAAAAAVAAGNGDDPATANPFNDPYVQGNLFRSCHGMIRAMAVQPMPAGPYVAAGNTEVYAELALGDNTKKVSSCLPCAMFMASFGMPASSIHLGRGDNWGLPGDVSLAVQTAWANSILTHYRRGITLFNPMVFFNHGAANFRDYIKNEICKCPDRFEDEIPYIFLEALTFESSFSDKITKTLWNILN
ncbi:MAG: hypothetical protein LBK66_08490 [Spirochaetaceae bacterium]|nr:hypothetical protein [Spirochaetaceae bacterium]